MIANPRVFAGATIECEVLVPPFGASRVLHGASSSVLPGATEPDAILLPSGTFSRPEARTA
jgi:hypothetical protein